MKSWLWVFTTACAKSWVSKSILLSQFNDETMEWALGTVPDIHEESFHAAFLLRTQPRDSQGGSSARKCWFLGCWVYASLLLPGDCNLKGGLNCYWGLCWHLSLTAGCLGPFQVSPAAGTPRSCRGRLTGACARWPALAPGTPPVLPSLWLARARRATTTALRSTRRLVFLSCWGGTRAAWCHLLCDSEQSGKFCLGCFVLLCWITVKFLRSHMISKCNRLFPLS